MDGAAPKKDCGISQAAGMSTDPPQARLAEGGLAGPMAQEATNGPRTGAHRLDQSEGKVNGVGERL